MKITSSQIKELKNLYKEHTKVIDTISDLKKTYQDRNGENIVLVNRNNQNVELKENVLWVEVYEGGKETQAYKIMAEKYPDLFGLVEKEADLIAGINLFTARNWGFFFNQMNLTTLIDIVIALIKFEILHFFFIDRFINLFKKTK